MSSLVVTAGFGPFVHTCEALLRVSQSLLNNASDL